MRLNHEKTEIIKLRVRPLTRLCLAIGNRRVTFQSNIYFEIMLDC